MNITLLTHYFPPETGAPQTRIWELCQRLAHSGNRIRVVTTFPHYPAGKLYPGFKNKLFLKRQLEDIEVYRTYTYITPNKGFVKRLMNHLSFCVSSFLAIPYVRDTEALIVEMPPLFLGATARLVAGAVGARLILNIADLWPESAIEMGALKNGLAISASFRLAKWLYNKADLILITAKGQGDILMGYGVNGSKIVFVPNGVDVKYFTPGPGTAIRCEYGLEGKFVVLYAGTLGLAHGLDNVIRAANILREHTDVVFLLVGDGAERDNLETLSRELKTDNVVFMGLMAKERMPEVLRSCDAGLVHLRKLPVFDKVLPSKTFEIMASAKPVFCVVGGEAARVVENSKGGIVVPQEDPAALAQAVLILRGDAALRARMGADARRYVELHHSRDVIAKTFEAAVRAIVDGRPRYGSPAGDEGKEEPLLNADVQTLDD